MNVTARADGLDLLLDSQSQGCFARRGRIVQVQGNRALIQHTRPGETTPILVHFPRSACYKTQADSSLLERYRVGYDVLFVFTTGEKPDYCQMTTKFVCPYQAAVVGQGFVKSVELREAIVRSTQFGDLVIKASRVATTRQCGTSLTQLWSVGDKVCFRGVTVNAGGGRNRKAELFILNAMLIPAASTTLQATIARARANLETNTNTRVQLPSSVAGPSSTAPLWPGLSKQSSSAWSPTQTPSASTSVSVSGSVKPLPAQGATPENGSSSTLGWTGDTAESASGSYVIDDSLWDELDKEICDRFTNEFDLLDRDTPQAPGPGQTGGMSLMGDQAAQSSSCSINQTNQQSTYGGQSYSTPPEVTAQAYSKPPEVTPHTYSTPPAVTPQSYSTPQNQSAPGANQQQVREHLLQRIMADPALSVLVFQKFPELAIQAFGN